MTKYVFVKSPVVHLIADTQLIRAESISKDLSRRGADVYCAQEGCYIDEFLPASGYGITEAERLSEFCGKLCYKAFGKNGSTKSTEKYLANCTYDAKPYGHFSIAYHSHFSLYISGISRRIGEELKRHVIGTSVSQMSSRYVIHPARFVVPPRYLEGFDFTNRDPPVGSTPESIEASQQDYDDYQSFKKSCKSAYRRYLTACEPSKTKKGLDKKRVLEAAAYHLPLSIETELVFTMNPISARKMIIERTGETADLEFQRLAKKIRSVLERRYTAFRFR